MKEPREFLNSKSMLTPGAAGSLTMLITNVLHQQFALPPAWVALILSLLLGTVVFGDEAVRALWKRGVFYLVNSMVIFAMAVGVNAAGGAIATPGASAIRADATERAPDFDASPATEGAFFAPWLS